MTFVATYLRNRESVLERLQNRFGFREERSAEYFDSVVKLIVDVVGTEGRQSEKRLSIDAAETKCFLESVDSLQPSTQWP